MNNLKTRKRNNRLKVPFYQTVAFKVFCILLVLGTVIGVTLYIVLKDDPSENNNNSTTGNTTRTRTGNTTRTRTGNTTRNECSKIPDTILPVRTSWGLADKNKAENGFANKNELKEHINKWLNWKYKIDPEQFGWFDIQNTHIELKFWNISNITDMSGLFENRTDFNEDINDWDVSHVTNMSNMFKGAKSFNQPLNNWNVSKVTNMNNMFNCAVNFNKNISGWDVSNVNNSEGIFNGATSMITNNKPQKFR